MAVRSDKIFMGQVTGTSTFVPIFTVPADRTLIVKRLELFHFGAGAGALLVRGWDGASQGFIFVDVAAAAGAFYSLERWDVLREGDALEVSVASGNFAVAWVSGALLEGDPS